jgi:hypothetical protein
MPFFSRHAKNGHNNDHWNARTIEEIFEKGKLRNATLLTGKTADVIYGYAPDGACVGLIRGKNGIIVTGFAAPEDYWKSV